MMEKRRKEKIGENSEPLMLSPVNGERLQRRPLMKIYLEVKINEMSGQNAKLLERKGHYFLKFDKFKGRNRRLEDDN